MAKEHTSKKNMKPPQNTYKPDNGWRSS
jgi:hypothetical protein